MSVREYDRSDCRMEYEQWAALHSNLPANVSIALAPTNVSVSPAPKAFIILVDGLSWLEMRKLCDFLRRMEAEAEA